MLLFKVENTYLLSGIGLALPPGLANNTARVGDGIRLVRPDGSILATTIKAIAWEPNHSIVVGDHVTKGNVPVGTEVWQIK